MTGTALDAIRILENYLTLIQVLAPFTTLFFSKFKTDNNNRQTLEIGMSESYLSWDYSCMSKCPFARAKTEGQSPSSVTKHRVS